MNVLAQSKGNSWGIGRPGSRTANMLSWQYRKRRAEAAVFFTRWNESVPVMESVTDAASAVTYVRTVQHALNIVMTLGITNDMWMPDSHVQDKAEYDYIVIGAGTAGAIVAGRIAQNRTANVLLVEHGDDPPIETIYPGLVIYTRSSPINYDFTTTSKPYNKPCGRNSNFVLNAGKMLGGSSSLNIMLDHRGTERDYEKWVKASKNPHWSLKDTLKYFKRTEKLEVPDILNSPYRKYHGVDGPLVVTQENRTEIISKYKEAFREFAGPIVLDLNSNETLGFSRTQYTISNQRESSATAFLKASDRSSYLDLVKRTEVTKILFDSNNNAVGIEALRNNKIVTFKARKEVILSAGVINTPKLLMLSGIGPKKHLKSLGIQVKVDLPVGKNYHDHVSVGIIYKLGKASEPIPEVNLREFPYPSITGYVALNKSSRYPDYVASGYFLVNKNAAKSALIDNALFHHYSNCVVNRIYQKTMSYKLLNSYIKNATPKSRGSVTLRSSNHKDDPIIDAGFFSNQDDLEAHIDYVQHYVKLGDTKDFRDLGAEFVDPFDKKCGGHEFGSRQYWKCYVLCMMNPSNHAVGTCAMGSVVDGELNVFGVNRLRVVDASVIPVITTGGTYAPTMMIAEKASSHLGKCIFYASNLVFAFIYVCTSGKGAVVRRNRSVVVVMDTITDAASAVSYVRGVQHALNIVMTLGITNDVWLAESHVRDKAEYDYIVVGAGTAGAIVAGRIAQNRTAKVLLVEHGDDPPIETIYPGLHIFTRSPPINYNFTTTSKPYNKPCGRNNNFVLNAGKMLGGSSSLNIMQYQRGTERDYEKWVKASKNPHWSLKDTLKYFKRTEKLEVPDILNSPYRKYHGVDGPLVVSQENRTEITSIYKEAFRKFAGPIVLDLNSNETIGFSRSQYTVSNHRETSATAFLKASDRYFYLDLVKRTEVIKILFDSNNNAVGIEALRNNKIVTFKARKKVILSAGVINTPKLLMLSGIGPKKHLESKGIQVKVDLPVGKNYHDHINVGIIYKLGKASGPTPAVNLREYPFPSITGYVALNKSSRYPDYVASGYFLVNKNAATSALIDTVFFHRYSYCLVNRIYQKSKSYKLLYSFIKNATPKSRGFVTLRSSNHKDDPIIDAGFFSNQDDLDAHIDYVQHYVKLGDTKGFKDLGAEFLDPFDKKCGGHEFGSRQYWKCYILCMMSPSNHGVGTCAMGSVVDGELNVFGVNRLRVVDASVIPVITTGGTYAPTMMIAEKASDIILQDLFKRKK
ncbi:hypothetical protein PYW08_016232 [Mythimna loreyi]|uniref:Uncharacterized protein n=1 Tax=Mythimna loreyi TaxID=667449 RepID=A0ACC2QYT5_9NEOP|nr:hypothetical protein PYW08_016232 [Mythimna loreyi]